jgi:hypothetical protein
MPELHARAVELVVEFLDAVDQFDRLKSEEVKALLLDSANVLSELLKRDIPAPKQLR